MPGVGLVQETAQGKFQLFLPFGEAEVVVPLLKRAPKARRDTEILSKRQAMKAPTPGRRAVAVTVGGATISASDLAQVEPGRLLSALVSRETISLNAQFEASMSRQEARETSIGAGSPSVFY